MTLVNVIAYMVVFGLPMLLVAEELAQRLMLTRKVEAPAPSRATAPATVPAGLTRRAA